MNKQFLKGWHFTRVVRLALGVFIIAQGIHVHDWSFAVMGTLLTLMPLLNIGCCGAGGCSIQRPTQNKDDAQEIVYEEIT